MSRKSITLALAAVVSLGAFALSSSDASAFRYVGLAGGAHPSSGLSGPVRLASPVHPSSNLHLNNYLTHKPILGIVIKPKPPIVTGIVINKPWPIYTHPKHWWWGYTWRRPYWTAPMVAAGGVATYAATTPTTAPATNRCTCLTKDYTPQGAVVFKDVCTNEMAMNPPVNASPAADMTPQMQQPIQQGYLQPQAQ